MVLCVAIHVQARKNFGWDLVGVQNTSDLEFVQVVRGAKEVVVPGLTKEMQKMALAKGKKITVKRPVRMVGHNNISLQMKSKSGSLVKLSFVGGPSYKIASGRNKIKDIVPDGQVVIQAFDIGDASMHHNVAQVFVTQKGQSSLVATSAYEKPGTRYLLRVSGSKGAYSIELLPQE